jgi:hypothetical protein
MACPFRVVDQSVGRAAKIATIAETFRRYGKSDGRHEKIAPFLPVRMRTGPVMDLDPARTGNEILVRN